MCKPTLFGQLLRTLFRSRFGDSLQQIDQTLPQPQSLQANNIENWREHWQKLDQPWRTEPEIAVERQGYLAELRDIKPEIEKGIYPFKVIEPKLSRADIEWLLATHENGRGPVDWNDEGQRKRPGLDLRGAYLHKVDLSGLPLACTLGGLTGSDWLRSTPEQDLMAAAQMEGTIVIQAHLEGAKLNNANLKGANLFRASLKGAELSHTHLEEAFINEAQLEGADFKGAHLNAVNLRRANLSYANLSKAHLEKADLEGVILSDEKHIGPQLADTRWENVNLTVVDWTQVQVLGDEDRALQKKKNNGEIKDTTTRLDEYKTAVRANRHLAVALQGEGLNEEAAYFAYRGQVLQRQVLQQQLLQRLKQTQKILDEKNYNSGILNDLSSILLIILSLLHYPSVQLVRVEQIRKNFFLKRLILIMIQLLFFIYLLALFMLLLLMLLFRLSILWVWLPLVILSQVGVLSLNFLIKQGQAHRRLQALLQLLRIEKFRQDIISEYQEFLLISKLFVNTIADNGQYAFSLLLDLLAGYGYKPLRTLVCYFLAVFGFAIAYNKFGNITSFSDALVFSFTSFHGRGFFPNLGDQTHPIYLHDPLVRLAAAEAVIGLVIEISFIATFTKRFFGS